MASSTPNPSFSPEQTNAAMRITTSDILETIARTREVLRQSWEAMARADRLLDGRADRSRPRLSRLPTQSGK